MKPADRKRSESLSSILGGDAAYRGTLTLEGSLRIDGTFEGTLTCGGSVTISEHGSFAGDLRSAEIILGGSFTGRAVGSRRVVLEEKSRFDGELACNTLHVNEGAMFNGSSRMGEDAVGELTSRLTADSGDEHSRDASEIAVKKARNGSRSAGGDGFTLSLEGESSGDVAGKS